jgi:hypothetical protein
VAGALLVLGALAAVAPAEAAAPRPDEVRDFPSAAEAIRGLLQARPRVIAFGEYHQQQKTVAIPSALARFTRELLALLRPHATDLVLETWIPSGSCGQAEAQVTGEVRRTTERPAATEDEIVTLAKRAKALGVQPWALSLTCADYAALQPADGGLDYDRLLLLIRDRLHDRVRRVLTKRGGPAAPRTVLVYGGALHNDRYPQPELARYAFGRELAELTRGRYLEVDLIVPEYVERDEARGPLRKEPWFLAWQAHERAHPGRVVRIRRGRGSYVIVFARQKKKGGSQGGAAGRPPR